jgi:hypothetical protein
VLSGNLDKAGTVTASLMLKKACQLPKQNGLAKALRNWPY